MVTSFAASSFGTSLGSASETERFIALSERLSCFTALAEPIVLPQSHSPHGLKGAGLGIKDLFDVPGFATTCGSKRANADPPSQPAAAIQRLLDVGMFTAGKTEMVELAVGGWGTNRARATPWNPWDASVHRVPGGSSSGSAVAVAAGLVNGAVGSDTGGSVRIPAAMCGIVGLKPGWGQISQSGMAALSPMLDVIGPMAGDVETVAAMYLAMLDSPVIAQHTQQQMMRWPLTGDTPLARLRIATPTPEELTAASPAVHRGFATALSRLDKLGATIEQIALEHSFSSFVEPTAHIFLSDGLRLYRDRLSRYEAEMDPWVVQRLRSAQDMSTEVYQRHVDARKTVCQRFCTQWENAELFALPTTPISAIPVVEVDETTSTLALYTRPFNYMDLPALAVPMGFDDAGLPLSLQLVGRPGSEGTLLSVGRAFMAAGSIQRLPPLHFEPVPTP